MPGRDRAHTSLMPKGVSGYSRSAGATQFSNLRASEDGVWPAMRWKNFAERHALKRGLRSGERSAESLKPVA